MQQKELTDFKISPRVIKAHKLTKHASDDEYYWLESIVYNPG